MRHQAITWYNADLLSNGLEGTNFTEILNEIQTFSFHKIHLKMLSAKWQPFCFNLNILNVLFLTVNEPNYDHSNNEQAIRIVVHLELSPDVGDITTPLDMI